MSQLSNRIEISMDDQTLKVIRAEEIIREFQVSTAARGMGFGNGSYRTPTGRFQVCEKIGEGEPSGTIFKSRVPVGQWEPEMELVGDLVLSRILRLDGLDVENRNTLERFIYIHGTQDEERVGQFASHGCVRLKNADIIELFKMVEVGCEVTISPLSQNGRKILFIDCDSTLSTIEGIDELARARGDEVFAQVVELTHAAMNGEVPIGEVFPRRMEMIRPNRALCDEVAALYVATIVPGAAELISDLKAAGWLPVILSGGFAPLIEPLAKQLGISHVEAVPLYFQEDGSYLGYGETYATTRNLGKNEIIREWKDALRPTQVMMMGDGISDLETRPDVDAFIGYGGVLTRPKVKSDCDYWVMNLTDRERLNSIFALPSRG